MTADEFAFIVKNGKRSNKIFGREFKPLVYYSYEFVKIDLPDLLVKGEINATVQRAFDEIGVKYKKKNPPLSHTLPFVLWLKDEVERIYELEREYLSSQPDAKLVNAGIKDLDELGEINVIDSLAGGDILKWDAIMKLPYHKIFDKQRKSVIESNINRRLAKQK